jgi:tetratricopeptide (TPR) repeat protein
MRKKIIFIFIFIFINFGVFAQLKKFTVEIPVPPKFELPDSIQSLTIMNRSLTSEFNDFDEKQLQLDFYKKNFEVNALLLDSTAADTTIKVLGELLFDSQRFDVVIPVDRNIYRLLPYNEKPKPLEWEFVDEICQTYNTDALVVLEDFAVRTVTGYDTGTEYDGFQSYKYHYASMDFYSMAHWRIYEPSSETILVDVLMNQDTIFWDNYDYDLVELFKALPTVKEATIQTGIKIALDFSDIIAPRWKSDTRYYYVVKNKKVDESVQLAAQGKWDEALDNWLKYADHGNRSTRSKIMLNIALGYEMTGDIEKAIEWAKKSLSVSYREVTNHYIKELLKRQAMLNN